MSGKDTSVGFDSRSADPIETSAVFTSFATLYATPLTD